jgi:hypothetical protein
MAVISDSTTVRFLASFQAGYAWSQNWHSLSRGARMLLGVQYLTWPSEHVHPTATLCPSKLLQIRLSVPSDLMM